MELPDSGTSQHSKPEGHYGALYQSKSYRFVRDGSLLLADKMIVYGTLGFDTSKNGHYVVHASQ